MTKLLNHLALANPIALAALGIGLLAAAGSVITAFLVIFN